ncbi:Transforming growth factor beta receptor type 3 [Bulinus truncatus]|nr:Transforming growth factor beta receptor type 3 [Bulinus truncatus]
MRPVSAIVSTTRPQHEGCGQSGLTTQVSQPNCGPVTIGPLEMTEKEINIKPPYVNPVNNNLGKSEQQPRIIIEGLDSATVVGIAFAAFAIGILLTGALWFIHSHTGDVSCCPVKRVVTSHRGPDASGDLTPNSSSPMTA